METIQTIMLALRDLPEEAKWRIFRYLRHPLAEIMLPLAQDYRAFQEHLRLGQWKSCLNSFYFYHFSEVRLVAAVRNMEQVRERFGVELSINEQILRPGLWRMYRREDPSTFPTLLPGDDAEREFSSSDMLVVRLGRFARPRYN
jgi:hypothetical protein